MRRGLLVLTMCCAACRGVAVPTHGDYLFVWAGDSAEKSSDFLAVIDAKPSSPTYGTS